MKKLLSLLTLSSVALVGCNLAPSTPPPASEPERQVIDFPDPEENDDKMAMDDDKMMEGDDKMAMDDHGGWVDEVGKPGKYTDYFAGVIGNGMDSVLFFHASWCPKCQANDKKLMSWYDSSEIPVSVYKIDYDTSTDLKQMFGVTQQDTFVKIDGNGQKIDVVSFPTESKLKGLIGA